MENCLGFRRSKQKQQQQDQCHKKEPQKLQLNPHNRQRPQLQTQSHRQKHLQQKMHQEKYDTDAKHLGNCESSNYRDKSSPTTVSSLLFPNFPPPPNYPPPLLVGPSTATTRRARSSETPTSHSGANTGSDIESSSRRSTTHRYPDDLNTIEVCVEQDSVAGKTYQSKRSGRSANNCGNTSQESIAVTSIPQVKWTRNNISSTMEKFPQVQQPGSCLSAGGPIQNMHHDYSYAYYEPGAAMRHFNIPLPDQTAIKSCPPPPNSIRALLSKGKKNKLLVSPSTRHSYHTRYGAQENFYEEISNDDRATLLASASHSVTSINQNLIEEVLRVQNRHRKILGELNLSVEAMLMPETPPSGSPTEEDEEAHNTSTDNIKELLNPVDPTDELLSPISSTNPAFCGDLDSGFSGSSGASYIGSLRYHKTNVALSNLMTNRKLGTNNTRPFYSGSCRSSQRSQDDPGRSILPDQCTYGCKIKSTEESVPSVVTESKARSFWNKKGWRKLPGFSSTISVDKVGIDEAILNSGPWDDSSEIKTSVAASSTGTTAQLQNSASAQTPYIGVNNPLILSHHHSKNCSSTIPPSHLNTIKTDSSQSSSPRRIDHTLSNRTINSSEDSWFSEQDHEVTSDDEDISESSVSLSTQRSNQLRLTFNKAKQHLSFDKWRTSGTGGGNSGNQQQQHQQEQSDGGTLSTIMPTARHQHESSTPGESPAGRLSRWFSIRRGSAHQYDFRGRDSLRTSPISGSGDSTDAKSNEAPLTYAASSVGSCGKMPELRENDDDLAHKYAFDRMLQLSSQANGTNRTHIHLITPSLPPAPAGLSQQQLKRRHIVAAIVHSENSYVATLQRLVNDYRKPLEESNPPILSSSKISTLFLRLPEILKSHKLFRIALADCVRNWDRDEKIGDVFVGAFSKPHVLEIYSGFINNFSAAMELAKMEAKRKSALADFFKVKQISALDRLSFFGLMVKPVQRFPQFILFLQDLLKYTPQGHHDRMSLQLALTQLETLAEMLNERKREAEQYQAFKEMLGHISGTFNTRSLTASASSDSNRHRYLLREDNVTQMEFNQSGFIIKSKQRRLLLLNDKVICVTVAPKQSHDFGATEKLSFKWMFPVTDVDIVDNSTSTTLSRILTAGLNRGGSLKSNSSSCGNDIATALTNGADNLCGEMSNLMHDYEVVSRISDLVGSLKGKYKEINVDIMRSLMNSIQNSIQKKNEEMAWVDSCCLQLTARHKSGKEETFTFQTENPSVKKEWITELRLAQLALDLNNSPAWEIPEHDQRPSTKMPLFVKAQPVYKSQHQTEVRCGCYYSITNDNPIGTTRRRFKQQNYLWVCTSDGTSSHIAVLSQHHQQAGTLKDVGSFDLVESQVTSMEFVKGLSNCITKEEQNSLLGDLVWMGMDSRKILIYSATNPEQEEQLAHCSVPGVVTKILYHLDSVFVALSTASLLIFRRSYDGLWSLKDPQMIHLSQTNQNVVYSILPINLNIYAGCGNQVHVLSASTGEVQKSFEVQHGNAQQVYLMAHSGIGLWVSLKNSSIICLYHTETFKHLQDINIASSVLRVNPASNETVNNSSIYVTALMACKGLLWVGTNVGISLTIPLPRLEGVPIISGGVNISYHAHFGPITFLLPLEQKSYIQKIANESSNVLADESVPSNNEELKNNPDNLDMTVILRKDNEQRDQDALKRNLEKQNSLELSVPTKLRAQLSSSPALRRKRFSEMNEMSRASKTLPRGLGSSNFFNSSIHSNGSTIQDDVYGLYGKLIFVKEDYAEDGHPGNLLDFMYEQKRRSDPELAAIPGKVSTLDRRLHMKASRPRSLDLSNWSVDSRSSSLYTSSGSEESMGMRVFGGRSVSRNSSSASHKAGNGYDLGNISENSTIQVEIHANNSSGEPSTPKKISATGLTKIPPVTMPSTIISATLKNKSKIAAMTNINDSGPRTILTVMGGRGYWRHVWYTNSPSSKASTSRVANSNDAHILVWEKKL